MTPVKIKINTLMKVTLGFAGLVLVGTLAVSCFSTKEASGAVERMGNMPQARPSGIKDIIKPYSVDTVLLSKVVVEKLNRKQLDRVENNTEPNNLFLSDKIDDLKKTIVSQNGVITDQSRSIQGLTKIIIHLQGSVDAWKHVAHQANQEKATIIQQSGVAAAVYKYLILIVGIALIVTGVVFFFIGRYSAFNSLKVS